MSVHEQQISEAIAAATVLAAILIAAVLTVLA
jgi:hypothetical protein